MATKSEITKLIADHIVDNDTGQITASVVKNILDEIVAELPSNDDDGSINTKAIIDGYLSAGSDMTLTQDSGNLVIAFDGDLLDEASVKSIINSHVSAGSDISVEVVEGKLQIAFNGTLLDQEQILKDIEVARPLIATFDDTSKKLSLSVGGYNSNPAFNNAATLTAIQSQGFYTIVAYNEALYDTFNIDERKFMVPPNNSAEHGILINLYEADSGFLDYVTDGLAVGIYQKNNDGTRHTIIEGTIRSVNNPNQRKLFLSLENVTRGDPIRDTNIAQPLYCLVTENKIENAINNAGGKDDLARANALTGINEARTAETTANLARTEAAAIKVTADLSLARTQRLTHITPWMYDSEARTIYIQWKPVKGLASGNQLTIRIEGITKTYTLTEGLAANDSQGLLIPFNATSADAMNVLRNAVNARSGYLLCSVEDATNGTSDYCWIPVVASMNWTLLTGSSPYTIANHYKEFLFEYGTSASAVFTQFVNRVQITTTDKTFLNDTERPDGNHNAELGVILSLNTNTLTASVRQNDKNQGTYSIQKIYAR